MILEVDRVTKHFDGVTAASEVSFAVDRGEVFGLLGPNGAGKTTTIRMVVDILKPDTGRVSLFGGPAGRDAARRIGYLPEDRGLYQRLRVEDVLYFLARLHGLPGELARRRIEKGLDRVGLLEWRRRRMRELSKGMQQKVQVVGVLLWEPELLILDEPFAGLDPLNRVVVEEVIQECAARGAAVVLSTHLMSQVERLCERMTMLHRGRVAIDGRVTEVRERFADRSLLIEADVDWAAFPEVESTEAEPGGSARRVLLRPGIEPEGFLKILVDRGARVRLFQRRMPTLDEVFVRVAGEKS